MTTENLQDQVGRPTEPPLMFSMLVQAMRQNLQGTVSIDMPGGETASFVVSDGRVVQVSHPATSSTAILGALIRSGIISDRDVPAVERAARKASIPLDEGVVPAGLVSKGTLATMREALCRETVVAMLLDPSQKPVARWTPVRGLREACALPLPFLLREAQRRHQELPSIRRVVSDPLKDFGRTAATRPDQAQERWEDLKIGAGERQVYFFLDGRRCVADIALATCQSEYEVSRAIASMHEAGLVRAVGNTDIVPTTARASRSALRRLVALLAAVVFLVAGIAWASWTGRIAPAPPLVGGMTDPYRLLLREAPEQRLLGAMRLYHLAFNHQATSFQDLADLRFVLPGDVRAAIRLGLNAIPEGQEAK
jgi:hypothetical protein